MTWHDLRATGLTWLAIRGDDPLKIKQRAGHSAFSTTEGYVRQAEAVRPDFDDVFPSLPMLVDAPKDPERSKLRSKWLAQQSWRRGIFSRSSAERAGFESDNMGRLGASRVAKSPQKQAGQATQEGPSRPPQPKPGESNAAIVAAIKVALDEGRHERAAALLEVLRRTEVSVRVVPLRCVAANRRR